jgi:hypothetical protein
VQQHMSSTVLGALLLEVRKRSLQQHKAAKLAISGSAHRCFGTTRSTCRTCIHVNSLLLIAPRFVASSGLTRMLCCLLLQGSQACWYQESARLEVLAEELVDLYLLEKEATEVSMAR